MMQAVAIQTGFILLLTLISAVTDWRRGKVYNVLTYPAALLGVAASALLPPPALFMSVSGLVACLFFCGALWYFGGIGAGDVKLLAAIGAVRGLPFAVHMCFYTVCAAAVAGVFLLAWQGRLLPVSKWIALTLASAVVPGMSAPPLQGEKTTIPFAPFIFIGVCVTAYLEAASGAPLSF
jgi:prepilin peptidase CpaA